jgi:hypothetical protein
LLPEIFELSVTKTNVRSQKVVSGNIGKLDYTQTGKTYRGLIEQVGETSIDKDKITIETVVGNKTSHRMPNGREFFGHLLTTNIVSEKKPRFEQTIVVSPEMGVTLCAFTKIHRQTVAEHSCVLQVN